jgi:hypothetical protein
MGNPFCFPILASWRELLQRKIKRRDKKKKDRTKREVMRT